MIANAYKGLLMIDGRQSTLLLSQNLENTNTRSVTRCDLRAGIKGINVDVCDDTKKSDINHNLKHFFSILVVVKMNITKN